MNAPVNCKLQGKEASVSFKSSSKLINLKTDRAKPTFQVWATMIGNIGLELSLLYKKPQIVCHRLHAVVFVFLHKILVKTKN